MGEKPLMLFRRIICPCNTRITTLQQRAEITSAYPAGATTSLVLNRGYDTFFAPVHLYFFLMIDTHKRQGQYHYRHSDGEIKIFKQLKPRLANRILASNLQEIRDILLRPSHKIPDSRPG